MLDIKFIRENKDLIQEASRKKGLAFKVDSLLKIDDKRRVLMVEVEKDRAEQNAMNSKISNASPVEKARLINDMKALKDHLKGLEVDLDKVMKDWQTQMLQVPNIPDISVPEGKNEAENVEVAVWGDKPQFKNKPKDHVELMESLSMVDFERGAKTHGFRGYFLSGAGAELSWALWNYAREFYGKKNFTPFIAPSIVRKQFFYGTGHLPREADDLFKTQDDDYLSGTAEVPMMAYYADEILDEKDLPKRFLAFSPCFRREAGSHGKDSQGLIRVHEFFKIEQLVLAKADHLESARLHEELNRNFEEFIESLKLPYRRLLICGGDLSPSKVKQYDTEVWFPSQNTYRELSSASYYHDFQSRRFNIRYNSDGKKLHVYSLNCTAVATPRIIGAIVENYQQENGSVAVPEVLQKFTGFKVISKASGK